MAAQDSSPQLCEIDLPVRIIDCELLSRQAGALVTRKGDIVTKEGFRVTHNEDAALRLVKQHTGVPVPTVFESSFVGEMGIIRMSWIGAKALSNIWQYIDDDKIKERVCHHTWELIYELRHLPKPDRYSSYFQCCVDGSASHDVLIKPLPEHEQTPLTSDEALRQRIYQRYLHFNGRRYEKELPEMLPQTYEAVFTHGDIAPRNILVGNDLENPVIGVRDWESAGWYPPYWEYANMMKPSQDHD
jgi:hypothetical protein